MSTSSPAHRFTILFKLLWGRGCFIAEASATLNLAQYFSFSNAMKPSPSMYDPYQPVKPHISQKKLCYHVIKNLGNFTQKHL